ncbi:MAG: SDR family NAD(P)-dependent oxidoreductase [Armatimonadetes bacterium]|nr:SDR family NAD(P)-dependent oxidoreductase [Armatimonadota bacterium]
MIKRAADIVVSALGLFLLMPLALIVSVLIKRESPGPVFYKQKRVGLNGKEFDLYKFRTMKHNPGDTGLKITRADDDRITRIGRFLRKAKLDELPQLLNILKGEMSLVGPRPEVMHYIEHYTEEQLRVLSVRPGLTGLTQLEYADEETLLQMCKDRGEDVHDFYIEQILPKKLGYDLRYVNDQSLKLDLIIFIKTLLQVVHKEAYKLPGLLRMAIKVGLDIAGIVFSLYIAFVFVYEGDIPEEYLNAFPALAVSLVGLRLGALCYFGLYHAFWRYTSITEGFSMLQAALASGAGFALVCLLMPLDYYPYSVIAIDAGVTLFLLLGYRILMRVAYETLRPQLDPIRLRTLIYGAGDAGEMIAREMQQKRSIYQPIGFVDDDPKKLYTEIHGLPVLGTETDLNRIVENRQVDEVVITLPSLTASRLKEIVHKCIVTNARVSIIPSLPEIIGGEAKLSQLRNIELEDLLSREPVKSDMQEVAAYLQGERVLVTGAGGSIGSEICRQIVNVGPAELMVLGHGENSIFSIEQELFNNHHFRAIPIIADMQDRDKLEAVFEEFKPTVVFHAAAHKHVPLMEDNPEEAIKNNVFGTKNLAEIARACRVKAFVLISTDKAVSPSSIMGASKRVAEMIVRSLSGGHTRFMIVRFGNVLGSRGSVVPTLKAQIERGGPVTVTHPEMTRYFMTIPEAVQLTLQAGAMGTGGEIFVLDMGEPVKILDLAKSLIRLAGYVPGKDISIAFTGPRPGEKLHEELVAPEEVRRATRHERIFSNYQLEDAPPGKIEAALKDLWMAAKRCDRQGIREILSDLAPGFQVKTKPYKPTVTLGFDREPLSMVNKEREK